MMERLFAVGVTTFARIVTGVRGNWGGCLPELRPRIYFANHSSHGDFILIWTSLPAALRALTRPVAAADYWGATGLRRYIGERVFRAVLIDRDPARRAEDPVERMAATLDQGSSLILFPEGTRNTTEAPLLPFKSGIYRLARRRPDIDLIPVWIQNLNRVMPKGEVLPIPLLCSVSFGAPLRLVAGEEKAGFCERARAALLMLAPSEIAG
jgi:1-acyl-sn-glycerol-3-phosphate acyltransferase